MKLRGKTFRWRTIVDGTPPQLASGRRCAMKLIHLPEDILLKILISCELVDLLTLERVCIRFICLLRMTDRVTHI